MKDIVINLRLALLFAFSFLFLFTGLSNAQCYQPNVDKGNAALARGNYAEAYDYYTKATKCPDASRFNNGQEAKDNMKKCLPVLTIEGETLLEINVGPEAGERAFNVQSKRIRMWLIDGGYRSQGIVLDYDKRSRPDSFGVSWEANPSNTPRDLTIRLYGVDGVKDIGAKVIIHQAAGELLVNGQSTLNKTMTWEGDIVRVVVSGVPTGQYNITGIDTSWVSVQKIHNGFFLIAKKNETDTERNNTITVSSSTKTCTIILKQTRGKTVAPKTSKELVIRNNLLSYDCNSTGKRTFGFIDAAGEVVIAPVFDGVKVYENGLCAVSKKINGVSRVGMIDEKANVVVPFIYKWIDEYCISNRIAVVDTNNRIGFLDGKGKLRIPCQYEPDEGMFLFYPHFVEGGVVDINLAVVRMDGLYGAIDTNGRTVVPFIYDDMSDFSGLARVKKNGKYGFVNKKGDVIIPIEYDDAAIYGPGRASINPHFDPFYDYHYDPYTYVRKGDVIRFIMMPKKRLSENEYTQWTVPLNTGVGERSVLYNMPTFVSNGAPFKNPETGKYGLLYYQTGNWFKYGYGALYYAQTGTWLGPEDEHDWMGKVWVPRRLVKDDGKWYFIDQPFATDTVYYDEAHEYDMIKIGREKRYVARVKKNNKWGVIDERGKIITDFGLDDILLPFDSYNGFTLVRRNEQFGYLDIDNHIIWRPNVELVSIRSNGLSILKVNDKYGYYAVSGLVTIQPQYDGAKDFSNGLAAVRIGTKWGFINKSGDIVIPTVFDEVESFRNGIATVLIDGKWYQIDKTGIINIIKVDLQ